MTTIGYEIIVVAVCVAAVVIVWNRRQLWRTMRQLDEMLDAAIRDEFRETAFDESVRSSVESKLADYLSASVLSAGQVQAEKENIKTLISDISHQTKTPLANILLYAQLLSKQSLPEPAQSCVTSLEGQTRKLQALIDSLVKLSRLESGLLSFHAQPGPLSPMLEEGVGLGLYLVRQIVAGQGGYVKVSGGLGQGAKFSLFLPRN